MRQLFPAEDPRDDGYVPPGEAATTRRHKFVLEPLESITFDFTEEWLVKRVFPRQGVGLLFGQPGSLKSFVALDLAMHIALGWDWAGRRTEQAPTV